MYGVGSMMTNQFEGSDTVTVTTDGRTVVDARKLLEKPSVKALIARISQKTSSVERRDWREPSFRKRTGTE